MCCSHLLRSFPAFHIHRKMATSSRQFMVDEAKPGHADLLAGPPVRIRVPPFHGGACGLDR